MADFGIVRNISDDDCGNGMWNSSCENTEDSLIFPLFYKLIASSLALFIFLLGLFGNTLVIVVIVRKSSMHTPTNCYLISLAVADILLLLSATLPAIPQPFFIKNYWPWGRAMCSVLTFLQYVGADASALSIGAFTIERYIGICYPIKAQALCTIKRAKRIILGIWMFVIMYCTPWLGLTTIKLDNLTPDFNIEVCTFLLERHTYLSYYMADLVLFYIVPLFLSAMLYALIIRMLYGNSVPNNQENLNGRTRNLYKSREQIVRMLIVIVVTFAVLWLPYRAVVVYNSVVTTDRLYKNEWYWLVSRVMVYVNSAINPILYNLMSVKFRKAFHRILCGCCHKCRSCRSCRKNNSDTCTYMVGTTFVSIKGNSRNQKNSDV